MTLVVIGLVLGLFRLRKTGGALIVAGLLWALAWSLPATSVWLGGALESRYLTCRPSNPRPPTRSWCWAAGPTAAPTGSCPMKRTRPWCGSTSPPSAHLAGRAPKVLLSGGALEGDVSEARGMAHAIRQQGVPERR